MKTCLLFALILLLLPPALHAAEADGKQMNLLIIHTDEHNFRTLGCYRNLLSKEQALMWGDVVVETPHLDWIAKNGAICTHFYATAPTCSPSRSSFVSGRYPQNTPVTQNNVPMNDEIVTFAEILKQHKYSTGYAGKWHLNGAGRPEFGPSRKFGFDDNRYMFNRGHWKQLEDTASGPDVASKKDGKPVINVAGADEKSFTTDFLADKTIDFIKANKDNKFCFMVSIPDPHGPDSVRAPYKSMFQNQKFTEPRTYNVKANDAPAWGPPEDEFENMAEYYGMVKCIDDNVGKIIEALRGNKLIDNTIIVFTADHGDLRGEHGRQDKGQPFEGSAKIPFLIYAPSKIKPGLVVNEALGCVDFLPTIINLMGFTTPGKEEGRDASSIFITGKAPDGWKNIAFFRSSGTEGTWIAAAGGGCKLVYSPKDDPWLFDLKKDPDELKNFFLDPAYREIVRQMSVALLDYGKKFKDANIEYPKVKGDIEWAVNGTNAFKSTSRPSGASPEIKRKKRKGGDND